jgi:hypothetical protein
LEDGKETGIFIFKNCTLKNEDCTYYGVFSVDYHVVWGFVCLFACFFLTIYFVSLAFAFLLRILSSVDQGGKIKLRKNLS